MATSSGLVPIETISVGDRVLTSDGRSETVVDESWRVVELEMPSPAGVREPIQIRLLRPPSWLADNGVARGRTVWLAFEEISLAGDARVTRIGPAPRIADVPGRVVLSTLNQTANDVVRLRFGGEEEVVEATSSHRFYSVDRSDWVRADNLEAGEYVRTASGTVAISRVDVLPDAQRVFNLEVEAEHEYFVSELRVLGHNACGEGAAGGAKRGPKTDPTAPHNATIRAEADALEAGGNTIVAGGGRAKERLIPTPGGHKAGRRPDILYETPDGTLRGRNVGRTRADGTPVTRETQALDDLNGPGGVPTDFIPYDR
ncbi:uncharacterized protein SOCEGT47_084190 [Sorangium cellulosum]|uniref:Intein C-terminal splicing domain-containing protein n=1 Tax=Sorangium cellulosum TaxID=56 RepID=A0A4P2QEF2_SORCE|nr:uncharacterized protein SOCEGT47_084190 [Sorangium cellulosum]